MTISRPQEDNTPSLNADIRALSHTRMEDLSIPNFSSFCQKIRLLRPRMQNMTREAIARALHITTRTPQARITLTGLLCFGRYPQAFDSSFAIELYQRDPQDPLRYQKLFLIEGRLDRMLEDALEKLSYLYTEKFTEKKAFISPSLLRTLLVNALIHRDYSALGSAHGAIRIFVHADRLIISNPCTPTSTIQKNNGKWIFPTELPNPSLMQLASYLRSHGQPLVQNLQVGLTTLQNDNVDIDFAIENHRWVVTLTTQKQECTLKESIPLQEKENRQATTTPFALEREVFDRVTIPSRPAKKSSIPRRLIAYLRQHGRVLSRALQNHIGCSRITLNKHIRSLLQAQKIEAIGHPNSPTRRYKIKK